MSAEITFDELVLLMGGHTAFQLVWAGVQLGVFDSLERRPNQTAENLRESTGLAERPLRILLTGLTALRVVVKNTDGYRNAPMTSAMLVKDAPGNWVDVLGWQAHIVYPGQIDFVESLKQNTNVGLKRFPGNEDNLYARLTHDPFLERVFQDAMSSLSHSANQDFVKNIDLSGVRHLVDAGGGNGENAMTVARAFPQLKVTIFDSPSVCEIAKANIRAAGMEDRVDTRPGNFFETDFPQGIDAIMFAHMLTIWSPEKDTALLKRAHDALPKGGRVIIFNMMGWDDETGPMTTALGSPYFISIATGQGMLYAWKEYEQFLKDAGFAQTQRTELPKDHGILVGVK